MGARQTPLPAAGDRGFSGRVGILLYDTTTEVDVIAREAVALIRARGIRTAGLLQRFGERLPNGKRRMLVEDIESGSVIRLDRPRGPGTIACMLDPDALAQAACTLQRAVASGADVLVVSRFGNAEADGRGMRAEIADAICGGAVVIIPVRFSLLDDLEGFLGEPGSLLLPSAAAIADWVEHAVSARGAIMLAGE